MNRAQRHAAILRLVDERPIGTQTELAEAMRRIESCLDLANRDGSAPA